MDEILAFNVIVVLETRVGAEVVIDGRAGGVFAGVTEFEGVEAELVPIALTAYT
jgi:hypothetical protein